MSSPASDSLERIKVIGCGGGGGNAVNRMVEAGLRGVEFVAVNTDAQDLLDSKADLRLQIGAAVTKTLGAGGDPTKGRAAAMEDRGDIALAVSDADMVFITAGMGGGTGTGSAPVVAQAAREAGALTVAVVTKPFAFEGRRRMEVAQQGLAELKQHVDTLIVVPNENLMQAVDRRAPLLEAFRLVDDVLRQGVQGIADLITTPGLINLDFNDVRAVMKDAGRALMGIGVGTGDGRAAQAATMAVTSPLLEGDVRGARSVLFNITSGYDLAMAEADEAAGRIAGAAGVEDTEVFFGVILDPDMEGELRLTVIATGFDTADGEAPPRRGSSNPARSGFSGSGGAGGSGSSGSGPGGRPTASRDEPGPSSAGSGPPSDDDLKIPRFLRDG